MIYAFILIAVIGGWTIYATAQSEEEAQELVTKRVSDRLQKLWDDAFESLRDNKFLRAERALLTI